MWMFSHLTRQSEMNFFMMSLYLIILCEVLTPLCSKGVSSWAVHGMNGSIMSAYFVLRCKACQNDDVEQCRICMKRKACSTKNESNQPTAYEVNARLPFSDMVKRVLQVTDPRTHSHSVNWPSTVSGAKPLEIKPATWQVKHARHHTQWPASDQQHLNNIFYKNALLFTRYWMRK